MMKVFSILVNVFTLSDFFQTLYMKLNEVVITVAGGRRPRISIRALCICSAVPSKNFPQPATNRVSPVLGRKERTHAHMAVLQLTLTNSSCSLHVMITPVKMAGGSSLPSFVTK